MGISIGLCGNYFTDMLNVSENIHRVCSYTCIASLVPRPGSIARRPGVATRLACMRGIGCINNDVESQAIRKTDGYLFSLHLPDYGHCMAMWCSVVAIICQCVVMKSSCI